MVEKLKEYGLIFVKRFFLGWYGVEVRLSKIEAFLAKIDAHLDNICEDCPSRRRQEGVE